MRRFALGALTLLAVTSTPVHAEVPVTLRGSRESMQRQNGVARELDLRFVRTPAELLAMERSGVLVRLDGNADYELAPFVSHPQVRSELRLFIEELAARYHAAVGEKLVVTSLTRPLSQQPRNAHELSVHPAGIAVDLRVSRRAASRQWLERELLALEAQGLLDVTRERTPPHYHVALFPAPYIVHVLDGAETVRPVRASRAARPASAPTLAPTPAPPAPAPPPPQRPVAPRVAFVTLLLMVPGALIAARRRQDAAAGVSPPSGRSGHPPAATAPGRRRG